MNYIDKASDYYSNTRVDLLLFIDEKKTNLKVLEIGAAYGDTLYYLKNKGIASEAVGVDIFEDKANPDKYKPIDRFIFGNIELLDFPEYDNYFDVVLLPDVLEHLIEPKFVLEKAKKYLKNEGLLLVSMPNIRHYSAFSRIFIKGDFKYDESGLFDYTHVRFYCKYNIEQLVVNAGFKIQDVKSSISLYQGKSMAKIINKLTFGWFEEFLSLQYFIKSTK